VGDLHPPVDRDGVVDRAEHGDPEPLRARRLDGEEAGPEALVVVHDVEVVAAGGEGAVGPQRERVRLGEAGRAHERELPHVDEVGELPRHGDAEGVGLPVQVEAREPVERDPFVELRVRRTGEDLDVVAEVDEGLAEVTGVHALAAAVSLAAVDEERDPEGGFRAA
jgi:hypothetical protein